jgi:hypothetical protein
MRVHPVARDSGIVGPNARPVRDPNPRPPRRHGAISVPSPGAAVARRRHRTHWPAGPVRPVRRAGRNRGARPRPSRGPPAHTAPEITKIRRQPLNTRAPLDAAHRTRRRPPVTNQHDLECTTGGAPRSPAWSWREVTIRSGPLHSVGRSVAVPVPTLGTGWDEGRANRPATTPYRGRPLPRSRPAQRRRQAEGSELRPRCFRAGGRPTMCPGSALCSASAAVARTGRPPSAWHRGKVGDGRSTTIPTTCRTSSCATTELRVAECGLDASADGRSPVRRIHLAGPPGRSSRSAAGRHRDRPALDNLST